MAEEPFWVAAADILGESFAEMRRCISGISTEGLNWMPTAADSNSLAAIAIHALTSTHSWLCVATGEPLPPRSRNSEFESLVTDPRTLAEFLEQITSQSIALLEKTHEFNGSALRHTHERPDPSLPREVPAAWALLHSIDHLREHVGQMLLTRQLWLDHHAEP